MKAKAKTTAKPKCKPAAKKKSSASSTPKATMKVGDKVYRQVSCHKTEASAKVAAKKVRATGKNARVKGTCVYARGRSKAKAA